MSPLPIEDAIYRHKADLYIISNREMPTEAVHAAAKASRLAEKPRTKITLRGDSVEMTSRNPVGEATCRLNPSYVALPDEPSCVRRALGPGDGGLYPVVHVKGGGLLAVDTEQYIGDVVKGLARRASAQRPPGDVGVACQAGDVLRIETLPEAWRRAAPAASSASRRTPSTGAAGSASSTPPTVKASVGGTAVAEAASPTVARSTGSAPAVRTASAPPVPVPSASRSRPATGGSSYPTSPRSAATTPGSSPVTPSGSVSSVASGLAAFKLDSPTSPLQVGSVSSDPRFPGRGRRLDGKPAGSPPN